MVFQKECVVSQGNIVLNSNVSTNMLRSLYFHCNVNSVYNDVSPDYRRFMALQSSHEQNFCDYNLN